MSVEAITWALRQRAGDPRAKIILLCLANYADEHGRCWPSQATLADQTEQSPDTVRRRLVDLEARGLIRREERRRPDGTQQSDLFVLLMNLTLPLTTDPQPAGLLPAGPLPAGPLPADQPGKGGRVATVPPHESLIDTKDTTPGARRRHLDLIESKLRDAGGRALDPTATGLRVLSEPIRWIEGGCDMDLDVVPTLKARCEGRRPASVRSWGFFAGAVFEARDRRVAPAPARSPGWLQSSVQMNRCQKWL